MGHFGAVDIQHRAGLFGAKYTIGGETFYYYSERNGYKMNDYHRLDVSVSHQFSVKDIPNESTFFRYRIYRNGELYKWTVFRDRAMRT